MLIPERSLQPKKAKAPILVIVEGILMEQEREMMQLKKASSSSIAVSPSGREGDGGKGGGAATEGVAPDLSHSR
jgi:hypothetical protein